MNTHYMLEAGLAFEEGSVEDVLWAMQSLPDELAPIQCSENEELAESGEAIVVSGKSFKPFVDSHQSGFFMRAPAGKYSIRRAAGCPLLCEAFLEVAPSAVFEFMARMAGASPLFGYACDPREREARNRISTDFGVNHIDAWVGRDVMRWLPGVYWLTLISEKLTALHQVDLAVLKRAAIAYQLVPPGQHLFKFYQGPGDWRKSDTVLNLAKDAPFMFDIDEVRRKLSGASTYLQISDVLRKYK